MMPPRHMVRRFLTPAWALLLSLVLLGPALGHGYVLTYDMVWVPRLDLGADSLGLGSALPRAVPSDAVVAVLNTMIPGMLLQKVVLLGALVVAGIGGGALVRDRSTIAQLVAVALVVWNPFVVERLVIGHWPLLVGYAVLPWLVVVLRQDRSARLPLGLPVLLTLGSLSASAGTVTAVVAVVFGLRRSATRRNAVLAGWVLIANAPWLVAGLLHAGSATSDAAGAELFATGKEGLLAGPWAALSFGGIWNVEVVPASRTGWAGLMMTALVVVSMIIGAVPVLRRRAHVQGLPQLALCWLVGWGIALLSWAAPGAIGWLAAQVPGGGLVRDGSRVLGLAVPLTVVLVATTVDAALGRVPDHSSRLFVGGLMVLVPISLMPDATWGVTGSLEAVGYPPSYAAARQAVSDAPAGDAVSLPFVSYRAPAWNAGGRRVLDPVARYLDRHVVVNDELVVSGTKITGEDPRATMVRQALATPGPGARAAALREAGVSVLVSEQIEGYPVPETTGRTTLEGPLTVTELGPASPPTPAWTTRLVMSATWLIWLGGLLIPAVRMARRWF